MAGIEAAKATLLDSEKPLDVRIRALYEVKGLTKQGPEQKAQAVDILMAAIDTTDSVLLQHEILYNLGQFGTDGACLARLEEVAAGGDRYGEVSRHEAIEAIGAIGLEKSIAFLEGIAARAAEGAPVRESCEIAIDRIRLHLAIGGDAFKKLSSPQFGSIDPAPAAESRDVAVLKAELLDASLPLFKRYRAMFALRDLNNAEASLALGDALRADTSSCLFRHEVAFVLGQLEAPNTIPALVESLKDTAEHGMVRHEAAEALGAMADAATWDLLAAYAADPEPIVRDSCVVALEMHKYWSNWKPAAAAPAEADAVAA